MKTYKTDNEIIKLLKVSEIRRIICDTDKGRLDLVIRKGETKYHLTLDSVPLSKEDNNELMDILFKPEVPEVNKEITVTPINTTVVIEPKKKDRLSKK